MYFAPNKHYAELSHDYLSNPQKAQKTTKHNRQRAMKSDSHFSAAVLTSSADKTRRVRTHKSLLPILDSRVFQGAFLPWFFSSEPKLNHPAP